MSEIQSYRLLCGVALLILFCSMLSQSVLSAVNVVKPSGEQVELEAYLQQQAYKQAQTTQTQVGANAHWLLIKLWSVDCGVCRQQVPVVSKIYANAMAASDANEESYTLTVLGISIDSVDRKKEVEQYIKAQAPAYPNWRGEYFSLAQWFKTVALEDFRGTPTYLLFDPEGGLAAVQTSILKLDSIDKFIDRY